MISLQPIFLPTGVPGIAVRKKGKQFIKQFITPNPWGNLSVKIISQASFPALEEQSFSGGNIDVSIQHRNQAIS